MIILAFETSSGHGSVALLKDAQLLGEATWNPGGSHAELLTPAIESVLLKAALRPDEIDHIAIGCGPGSFTGARVSVNAARTLGAALGKTIFVYDTSEILLSEVPVQSLPILVIINAHKNLVFASTFVRIEDRWQRRLPLALYHPQQLDLKITEPHLGIGEGFTDCQSLLTTSLRAQCIRQPEFSDRPQARRLGLMAFSRRAEHPPLVWKEVRALYLRPSGAEELLKETGKGDDGDQLN